MHKKMIILSLAVAAVLSVLLCFQISDDAVSSIHSQTFYNMKDAQSALAALELECEDKSNCSEAMGAMATLTTRKEYSVERGTHSVFKLELCSIQLIAADRVIARRDCLPKKIAIKGASCSGRAQIYFPRVNSHNEKTYACDEVVEAVGGHSTVDQNGWVTLRLNQSVNRSPLQMDVNKLATQVSLLVPSFLFQETTRYSREDRLFVRTIRGVIKAARPRET